MISEARSIANGLLSPSARRVALLFLVAALCLVTQTHAHAQAVRPGDERPELPQFEPPEGRAPEHILPLPEIPGFDPPPSSRGTVLPRLVVPVGPDITGLEGGDTATLRAIHIIGNTVLRQQDLEEIARPYLGRDLGFADLQELRDALTLAYVDRGYATSGAVIPDQSLAAGVLEVWMVEPALSSIQVQTEGRLRPNYLRQRIALGVGTPLNVYKLEEALQILQRDKRIASLHATLEPSQEDAGAVLRVRVIEARAWEVRMLGNNFSAPSLGEQRGELHVVHRNVTGFGDTFRMTYRGSEGLHDISASYALPISSRDTTLELDMRRTWSEVVTEPFDSLDIKSETETYGITLRHPLYRSTRARFSAFLTGEYRRSKTWLLGRPFSFVFGPINGIGKETVLRLGLDWSAGSRTQAVALRSMFSVGIDAFGATHHKGDIPDGQFFTWLGQAEYSRLFPALANIQLITRANVQLADRPLLGLEQFAVGGHASVRGYTESQLVRDNGLIGSIELRLPVPMPSWRERSVRFELAPFFDAGYSWNTDRSSRGPTTLLSVGLGGRLSFGDRMRFRAYWGHRLKNVLKPNDAFLQDDGVHVALEVKLP